MFALILCLWLSKISLWLQQIQFCSSLFYSTLDAGLWVNIQWLWHSTRRLWTHWIVPWCEWLLLLQMHHHREACRIPIPPPSRIHFPHGTVLALLCNNIRSPLLRWNEVLLLKYVYIHWRSKLGPPLPGFQKKIPTRIPMPGGTHGCLSGKISVHQPKLEYLILHARSTISSNVCAGLIKALDQTCYPT